MGLSRFTGLSILIAIAVLFTTERRSDLPRDSFAGREAIQESNEYPWCEWSGRVKNGKPDGPGEGGCVYGQEPKSKIGLRPAIERIDTQERGQFCREPPRECACKRAIESSVSIDFYTTFNGVYADGKRSGQGIFFDGGRGVYIGHWKDDMRHGHGTLYSRACQIIYSGAWCEDRPEACKQDLLKK